MKHLFSSLVLIALCLIQSNGHLKRSSLTSNLGLLDRCVFFSCLSRSVNTTGAQCHVRIVELLGARRQLLDHDVDLHQHASQRRRAQVLHGQHWYGSHHLLVRRLPERNERSIHCIDIARLAHQCQGHVDFSQRVARGFGIHVSVPVQ